ncbi:MAG TPA: hypothetical protein DCY94_03460 [Firmicutes bacterium]|nr:hypothetical protein [Bacillota bacterium]
MIIIYDFDGTLTPYAFPQYEVLKMCGYDDGKMKALIAEIVKEKRIDLYEAYCEATFRILQENGIDKSDESIYRGADLVEFNRGVLKYFEKLSDPRIRHYVVTSGFEEYVKRTEIYPYLRGLIGTRMTFGADSYNIDFLMKDETKVDAIKEILSREKRDLSDCIYVGDGLTDRFAFEYVHNGGGEAIFLCDDEDDVNYRELKNRGIIDYKFDKSFEMDSLLMRHILSKIEDFEPKKL